MAKQHTLEPTARKSLFLPKNKGGLSIKDSEAHNLAIRIKHLLALKQKKKTTTLDAHSNILVRKGHI